MARLDINSALIHSSEKEIKFGISLLFPQKFKSLSDTMNFFKSTYFGTMGAAGRASNIDRGAYPAFGTLAPDQSGNIDGLSPEISNLDLKGAEDKTLLNIVLSNDEAVALEAEANFITFELNAYREEGFILEWGQFSLLQSGA